LVEFKGRGRDKRAAERNLGISGRWTFRGRAFTDGNARTVGSTGDEFFHAFKVLDEIGFVSVQFFDGERPVGRRDSVIAYGGSLDLLERSRE
jgi:hypothetical protein